MASSTSLLSKRTLLCRSKQRKTTTRIATNSLWVTLWIRHNCYHVWEVNQLWRPFHANVHNKHFVWLQARQKHRGNALHPGIFVQRSQKSAREMRSHIDRQQKQRRWVRTAQRSDRQQKHDGGLRWWTDLLNLRIHIQYITEIFMITIYIYI